jgi:hypothetical protein
LAPSRSRRRAASSVLAPAASLLAAAALAGCGPFGDDDEPDEEEFAQRGDEICLVAQERVAELQRDLPRTPRESARFTEELLEIFEEELAELESLEPPADRREAFERYLRARLRAIGYVEEGLGAAQGGNALAYADAQARVADEQVERAKLAKQSGLNECSRPVAEGGGPGGG